MKPEFLTLQEAAILVNCKPASLRIAIRNNEVRAAKRFGKWLIKEEDVRRWSDAKTVWNDAAIDTPPK